MLFNFGQDMRHTRRSCRIVINTAVIQSQRKRIVVIHAQAYGAQEAIFHTNKRHTKLSTLFNHFIRSLARPDKHGFTFLSRLLKAGIQITFKLNRSTGRRSKCLHMRPLPATKSYGNVIPTVFLIGQTPCGHNVNGFCQRNSGPCNRIHISA